MSKRLTALSLIRLALLVAGLSSFSVLLDGPALGGPPDPNSPNAGRNGAPATDLYGDPLPPGAIARLGTTRLRNGTNNVSVSFSPDGTTLYTGSGHTIRSWDVASGAPGTVLPRIKEYIEVIAALPDGKTLAAGGHEGVTLWDMTTGKRMRHIKAGSVRRMAFSADGKTLVCRGEGHDAALRVFDVASGKELRRMTWHQRMASHLIIAPDGRTLISATYEEPVHISDLMTGELLRVLSLPKAHFTHIGVVSLSADGKSLVVGGYRRPIGFANSVTFLELYDVATGKLTRVFDAGERPIPEYWMTGAVFTADGTTVIVSSSERGEGTIAVWDLAKGKAVRSWEAPGFLRQISPDNRTLALVVDVGVELWDIVTGKRLHEHESHAGSVQSLSFSPDGKTLATTDFKREVWLWDVATSKLTRKLGGHEDAVRDAQFLPDGSGIITGGIDGTLRLWDHTTGKEVRKFSLSGRKQITGMRISADGKKLMSASTGFRMDDRGHDVNMFDITNTKPEMTRQTETTGWGFFPIFSPDGKMVLHEVYRGQVDGLPRGDVVAFDLESGKELIAFTAAPDRLSTPYAFSPDGKWLASRSHTPVVEGRRSSQANHKVRVFDVATGKERYAFDMAGGPMPVAFSKDSRYLAAANYGVFVWDMKTGKQVWRSPELDAGVSKLAFAPDGKTLAAGMRDTSILIWDLTREPGK